MHLDRQQGFALLAEMTSTRNLLAYGIRVIRTGAFIDTTRDPIFTMLSIGVEKLYKLTLGIIALDRDHRWPVKTEMQKQGHKLVPMHTTVMNELRARTVDKSEYVRGLLADVDNDPVVLPIIEALDMYGRMGRFYYLDELGAAPQSVSPDEGWQNIEHAALADPAKRGTSSFVPSMSASQQRSRVSGSRSRRAGETTLWERPGEPSASRCTPTLSADSRTTWVADKVRRQRSRP